MKHFKPTKEVNRSNNEYYNINTEITEVSEIKYQIINYINRLTPKIVKVFNNNDIKEFQFILLLF